MNKFIILSCKDKGSNPFTSTHIINSNHYENTLHCILGYSSNSLLQFYISQKDEVVDIYMTMPDTAYELLNKRLPEGTKIKTYVKQYLRYLDYYNEQYLNTWEYE